MSTHKTNLLKFQNITSGNMALTSVTSTVSNILNLDNIGFEATWSGSTPIGVISIEVSIDYAQDSFGNVTNSGTWTALSFTPTPAVSGNTGSLYIDMNQLSAPWLRAKYTKTSGTGTIQGYICGKMV